MKNCWYSHKECFCVRECRRGKEVLELYSEDLFRKVGVSRLHPLGDSMASKESRAGDNSFFWRKGKPKRLV